MKQPAKYLIVIGGPTAVGKSSLALKLADWLATEILSADSRQIYREMNIGTAKPTIQELEKIRHHFVDELNIDQSFSAAKFEEEGLRRLKEIYRQKQVSILCGGTGLYIKALTHGLDRIPDVSMEVRQHFDLQFQEEGIEVLQKQLANRDPEYARNVDLSNHRRLIRALSVIEATGKTYSSFLKTQPLDRGFERINILLIDDRKILYNRIDQRVDEMIQSGLEHEVENLLPYREHQALQTVGYQEWFPYFDGMIDREEVIRLIKRNSRRYAKRQMTWFRKYGDWTPFPVGNWNSVKLYIESKIE